jgi:hypothetical protein
MQTQAHLLRQFHLVLKLREARGRPIPFPELQRHLLEQTSVGDFGGSYELRTFQRDRPLIAENFGVSIRHRRGAGYYVAETNPLTDGQHQLLDAFELQAFLRLPAALGAFVQPEPRQARGLEYLRPLLRAAQAGEIVELEYLKHWETQPRRRTFGPLLLREFRGRWYVLACMENSGWLACFGLDRIQKLTFTHRRFSAPVNFDPATYFAHAFGITRPTDGQPPQEILLRFEPVQGRYVLGFPLHPSQQLVSTTEDGLIIQLTVYNTHELRMELLSYGASVEVISPLAIRQWLHETHLTAATN